MLDRRTHPRDRVLFGGTISAKGKLSNVECVVRNISHSGANVELPAYTALPDDIRLSIAKTGKSLLAKIVWWRANRAGIAFENADSQTDMPSLEERLRISERKARALKQRVAELLRES